MIITLIIHIKTFSISGLPFKILNVEGMIVLYKLHYNIVAENKSAINLKMARKYQNSLKINFLVPQ